MKKSLLITNDDRPVALIDERNIIRLIVKNKVECIDYWDNDFLFIGNEKIKYPCILKLKENINLGDSNKRFSRKVIFYRDNYTCAYCLFRFEKKYLTIDHVYPKSLGGETSFENCVTACINCNQVKADKTLDATNMELKIKPFSPNKAMQLAFDDERSDKWIYYL